jgi:hypothetical protein
MNINNLFDYCNGIEKSNNVLLKFNSKLTGNSLLTLAVSENKILTYSNEWLYLIKNYYPNNYIYHQIIDMYNNINTNNNNNIININEDVLSFITSFSTGTVHGYSGLYYMIIKYIENIEYYKNFKIIVAKNSQSGILNIINHFKHKQIFNNIIFLNPDTIYKFKSVIFIKNIYHNIYQNNDNFTSKISELINKYVIIDKKDLLYYKSLNLPKKNENICILKSNKSVQLTNTGTIDYNDLVNFSNKNNLTIIEPDIINEIILIHTINICNILVVSWGTSFMKNFVYISDKCKKIIVLIIGNIFIEQYNNIPNRLAKFKNADIIYKIVNPKLDFQLY